MRLMSKPPALLLRAAMGLLALVGLVGVVPVSLAELVVGGACPHLGPLPACHLVTVAYGVVLISVLRPRLWTPALFAAGWAPIFLLAAAGSGLELLGHGTCPKTEGGMPKCFFSLGLAVALFVPFAIHVARAATEGGARLISA